MPCVFVTPISSLWALSNYCSLCNSDVNNRVSLRNVNVISWILIYCIYKASYPGNLGAHWHNQSGAEFRDRSSRFFVLVLNKRKAGSLLRSLVEHKWDSSPIKKQKKNGVWVLLWIQSVFSWFCSCSVCHVPLECMKASILSLFVFEVCVDVFGVSVWTAGPGLSAEVTQILQSHKQTALNSHSLSVCSRSQRVKLPVTVSRVAIGSRRCSETLPLKTTKRGRSSWRAGPLATSPLQSHLSENGPRLSEPSALTFARFTGKKNAAGKAALASEVRVALVLE